MKKKNHKISIKYDFGFFKKNNGQQIGITIVDHYGVDYIDIKLYYQKKDMLEPILIPNQGLTLKLDQYIEIIPLVQKGLDEYFNK